MGLASALSLLAGLVALAAWIWLIVVAFKDQNRLWGTLLIVGLLVPVIGVLAPIIYTITNWQRCRKPAIAFYSATGVSILCGVLFLASLKNAIENSPELAAAIAQAQQASEAAARQSGRPPGAAPDDAGVPAPAPREDPAAPAAPTPAPAPKPKPEKAAPAKAPTATTTVVPFDSRDPRFSSVRLKLISLGEAGENQMRTLQVQIANTSSKPVREVKLDLTYLDKRGERLGAWTTIHSGTEALTAATSTNEFSMTAFFVPHFTSDVHIGIESVVFTDGSRWPAPQP